MKHGMDHNLIVSTPEINPDDTAVIDGQEPSTVVDHQLLQP